MVKGKDDDYDNEDLEKRGDDFFKKIK